MALASTQTGIAIERETRIGDIVTREMNYWDKFILQNAHPMRLIFNGLSIIWSFFYAYRHQAVAAVVIGVVFLAIGVLSVDMDNLARFSTTRRFQFLEAMNNPLSVTLDVIALVVLYYAAWQHSVTLVLCAVSTAALSRAWSAYKYFGR
jgi:hypothetical protein